MQVVNPLTLKRTSHSELAVVIDSPYLVAFFAAEWALHAYLPTTLYLREVAARDSRESRTVPTPD